MASKIISSQITRSTQQVQQDLHRLESNDSFPGLQAQITVSLNAIKKSTDELDELAKREISTVKREKAIDRVQRARQDYAQLKSAFENCKNVLTARAAQRDRDDLLERRTASTVVKANNTGDEVASGSSTDSSITQMGQMMKETNVLNATSSQLDDFITIGRTALLELHEQRGMLKSSKRRLLDVANSLGMSTNVIRFIERRSVQDQWFLLAGVLVSVFLMWAIVHFLT